MAWGVESLIQVGPEEFGPSQPQKNWIHRSRIGDPNSVAEQTSGVWVARVKPFWQTDDKMLIIVINIQHQTDLYPRRMQLRSLILFWQETVRKYTTCSCCCLASGCRTIEGKWETVVHLAIRYDSVSDYVKLARVLSKYRQGERRSQNS